jgi:Meiotically up-regulated gene 113
MAARNPTGNLRDALTTGQVATVCLVTAKTVSKWIDSGLLPGWKIPASPGSPSKGDRRVYPRVLAEFIEQHGMTDAGRRLEDFLAGRPVEKFTTKFPQRDHVGENIGTRDDPSGYVYFIQVGGGGAIKIGFSHNAAERVRRIQGGSLDPVRCIGVMLGGRRREYELHRTFGAHRVSGEWFRPHPSLMAYIAENAIPLDVFTEIPGVSPALPRNGADLPSEQPTLSLPHPQCCH